LRAWECPQGTVKHIIADLGMLYNMEDRIGGQQGAHPSWQSCIRAKALVRIPGILSLGALPASQINLKIYYGFFCYMGIAKA